MYPPFRLRFGNAGARAESPGCSVYEAPFGFATNLPPQHLTEGELSNSVSLARHCSHSHCFGAELKNPPATAATAESPDQGTRSQTCRELPRGFQSTPRM